MILRTLLVQVLLIGAGMLACFRGAACEVSQSEIQSIHSYWHARINCIEEEIKIRKSFFKTIEYTNLRIVLSDSKLSAEIKREIEAGRTDLSELKKALEALKKKRDEIMETARSLMDLYKLFDIYPSTYDIANRLSIKISEFLHDTDVHSFRTKVKKTALDRLLLPALKSFTSAIKKINEYDSHMLRVVEIYSKVKDKNSKINELALFKLAKSNKMLAAGIIFSFFEMRIFDISTSAIPISNYLCKSIMTHIPAVSVRVFINAVIQDVLNAAGEKKGDPLVSADRHLHLLFCNPYNSNKFVVDTDTMNMYLNLSKTEIAETEIEEHRNITPGQVVKILMLECLMSGHLLDYRRNSLFFALGRVIESVFRIKDENIANISEELQMKQMEQDKMLDVLSILWNDCAYRMMIENIDTKSLCKENSFELYDLKWILANFMSVKWMYEIDRHGTESDDLVTRDEIDREMHFDMSYTHPMWYICRRCEYINEFTNITTESNEKRFMEEEDSVITLRPYRISANDGGLARAQNMRSCIKAWFSKSIEIISREEEKNSGSYSISNDFYKYLKNSVQQAIGIREETGDTEEVPYDRLLESSSDDESEEGSLFEKEIRPWLPSLITD
ncbi:hypothetical protein NEMIN01_0354 [Nematocida minor]|uniref:uncharacterized protein n=1 Tax=Nematocida minor TaxID=1912983 RepID=UPI0022201743|nr:uncharacterized protein NEMIN01_0354 [Nematocida minor]KAI5189188.1 hypothetical protein NEMIN01_0354 [Nematocida minor]